MYSDACLAVNHFHMMSAAMSNFNLPIIYSALVTIAVISIVLITVRVNPYRFPSQYVYAMPFAFALVTWQVSQSGGVVCQFPSFFRIPICMGVALSDNIYPSQRDKVLLTPTDKGAQKLIFIIDESITGSRLSLNGDTINSTPFLSSNSNYLINFGIAQSVTNYSAGSNALLMTGIPVAELPNLDKSILKTPTIFQYAKKAGYETYYIDAQMAGPGLQNYMSPNDLPYIDHFIRVADSIPRKRYFERDMAILDWIQKISKSSHKTFVVTNKAGAHWPYGRTFPKDSAIFKPFIQNDRFTKDRNITLNSYYNSIRWSVDTFWKRLIKNSNPQDSVLFVYTSDHGQDLSGSGNQISHASVVDTKPSEVDVPIWLYDRSHYIPDNFKPQKTRYSHEQIFPSLLIWMGYTPQDIQPLYGASLLDSIYEKPRFWVGDLFGRGISKQMIVP
jgi:lipid A ethanolaminephosphotransferase